jgi:DNA repair exonuclease SbcCD ATPase subunit
MIRSLEIFNFQSHGKSKLNFSEGVNVIVGASDSGKTALIRALRWVVWGRPTGDSIRSNWGGETSVALTTEDGTVLRTKDKSDSYVLAAEGREELTFKAFGTTVPQEVSSLLNLSELNLQSQLDSPFLLSMSPGEVATFFNKVAKLESIDKGTTNINSAIRELTSDIKYKTEQETRLTEEIATYPDMEIYEYDVSALEDMDKEKAVLANSVNKLHATTSAYRLVVANLKEKSEILKAEKPLNNILDLIDQKKHTEANVDKLTDILARIYHNQGKIIEINKTLTLERHVLELLQLHTDKKIVKDRVAVLSVLLSNMKGIQDRVTKGNAFIEAKNSEWEALMPVGSICLLCGQEIKR